MEGEYQDERGGSRLFLKKMAGIKGFLRAEDYF